MRWGGTCGTIPFYLLPDQGEPEYDHGDSVVVWYDDLYELTHPVAPETRAALVHLPRHFGIAEDGDQEYWVKWSDIQALLSTK